MTSLSFPKGMLFVELLCLCPPPAGMVLVAIMTLLSSPQGMVYVTVMSPLFFPLEWYDVCDNNDPGALPSGYAVCNTIDSFFLPTGYGSGWLSSPPVTRFQFPDRGSWGALIVWYSVGLPQHGALKSWPCEFHCRYINLTPKQPSLSFVPQWKPVYTEFNGFTLISIN